MPLLEVDDVVVQFGGVTAVDHASFVAEAGRVTGLIGPNGAGKTTCFNVITGLQKPDRGRVALRRPGHHPAAGAPPLAARDGAHLPAAGGLRVADGRGQRAGRARHPPRLRAACSGRPPPTSTGCSSGSASRRTPTSAPTRSRPAPPGCSSWPGAWPATRSCCCSTSRPRASTRRRPTRSASCCAELAAEGRGDPDGRARHGPGDVGLRRDPRPRLRLGHRLRAARRDPGQPATCSRPTSATPTTPDDDDPDDIPATS